MYASLRGNFSLDYFFRQTLSSNETILPARGSDWYDNKNYLLLHYHTWTKDHPWTGNCWSWLLRIIGIANQSPAILETNLPESARKNTNLAKIKMIRALAYFMKMNLYVNVPILTVYGDFAPRAKTPRAEVFSFVESEIKACIP